MSKSKYQSKNDSEDNPLCPVIFCWGTFCRSVLNNETDRTIHTVLPGLKIGFSAKPFNKDRPVEINLPLGELAIYALLERAANVEGEIKLNLVAELNLPTKQSRDLQVILGPEHTHFQLAMCLDGAYIPLKNDENCEELSLTCTFKHENKELGKISLPIKIANLSERKDI